MKKFLFLGLAALGVVLATDRPASAWINAKFSVGMNWHWQSGGNSLFWGMFRNSQPPAPDHGPGGHGPGGYGGIPYGGAPYGGGSHPPAFPGFAPYGPNDFQWFGNQQQPGAVNPNGAPTSAPAPAPAPAAASAPQQHAYGAMGQNPYHAVSYAPNYQSTGYGYPGAGAYYPGYYGYYQAPSYWYGR